MIDHGDQVFHLVMIIFFVELWPFTFDNSLLLGGPKCASRYKILNYIVFFSFSLIPRR